MILKPPALRPGDTLAVVAPAGPVKPSEVQPGMDLLKASGFEVFPGEHLFDQEGYLAGHDAHRLADLHAALRHKEVKAVFCARGGYGTLRLLEKIDFRLFRRHPKILVGYSDITALHLALRRKTGLVTFHGPMLRDLLRNGHNNLECLLDLISRGRTLSLDLCGARILRQGRAEGPLVGGNLSLITHLLGTGFMPDLRGTILLVEDTGEAAYRIDRMLTHLRLSGRLKEVSALLAGRFEGCGQPDLIDELVLHSVADLNVPVLSGLPFGHGKENAALPLGLSAVLDTGKSVLAVTEPAVAL